MSEKVILVDKNDNEIGTEEKLAAHKEARLHRAFSIFIFNSQGQLLLQKRASAKYHCPGLWTNTCCSHPRPGEKLEQAIHRRLQEEMGFDCELKEIFHLTYQAKFGNGLTENEYDHVFIGKFAGQPQPNPEEVDECKWIAFDELKQDIQNNPEKYTPWFKIIIQKHLAKFQK